MTKCGCRIVKISGGVQKTFPCQLLVNGMIGEWAARSIFLRMHRAETHPGGVLNFNFSLNSHGACW